MRYFPLVFILIVVLRGSPAYADLTVCNKHSAEVSVAIGHLKNGEWTSEGWWNIGAGTCEIIVAGDLTNRLFYLYAYASSARWGGSRYFCTAPREFFAKETKDCQAEGYDRTGFFEVDTGWQSDWTLNIPAQSPIAENLSERLLTPPPTGFLTPSWLGQQKQGSFELEQRRTPLAPAQRQENDISRSQLRRNSNGYAFAYEYDTSEGKAKCRNWWANHCERSHRNFMRSCSGGALSWERCGEIQEKGDLSCEGLSEKNCDP